MEKRRKRRQSQWNEKRLQELEDAFGKLSPSQLAKKFGQNYEILVTVLEFRNNHKKLLLSQQNVTETIDGKTTSYRVTIYAPGFAEGVRNSLD